MIIKTMGLKMVSMKGKARPKKMVLRNGVDR